MTQPDGGVGTPDLTKSKVAKKPPTRRGNSPKRTYTVATVVDRLLEILADGTGDTREDLLHHPEKTYLNGLSAADLIGKLRETVVAEAMARK